MRILVSLFVAIILFSAVGYYRYGVVAAEEGRYYRSGMENCDRVAAATSGEAHFTVLSDCHSQLRRTIMSTDIQHYILGAWLWAGLAALLGGVITFILLGRRSAGAGNAAVASTSGP